MRLHRPEEIILTQEERAFLRYQREVESAAIEFYEITRNRFGDFVLFPFHVPPANLYIKYIGQGHPMR